MSILLGWWRSKRALITRIDTLNVANAQFVIAAAAMRDSYRRDSERQRRRIHALTEETKALRQALANGERRDVEREAQGRRASVVDAFKRQGGILNPPPERLHPNALTDTQRQDAADEARYKRHLDGLGDQ